MPFVVRHPAKSWGGCQGYRRNASRTLTDIDYLLERLAANAWAEDPRPLDAYAPDTWEREKK